MRRPGGLGRSHEPLSLPTARSTATLLGGTTDDAAGEAFDKVASLLGLGYPGGPGDRAGGAGRNPPAFAFPRSFLHDERLQFSFSGLEDGRPLRPPRSERAGRPRVPLDEELVGDVAASFQEAVVDVLVAKTRQALVRSGLKRLGVGGGVAANSRFRDRIAAMAAELGVELFIPPLALCTDNAAMAGIALPKLGRARSPIWMWTSPPDWSDQGRRGAVNRRAGRSPRNAPGYVAARLIRSPGNASSAGIGRSRGPRMHSRKARCPASSDVAAIERLRMGLGHG